MKKVKMRISTQVLVLLSVLLFAVNAGLGLLMTHHSQAIMKTLIHARMLDISNTAAALLNGDELQALNAEDADTPEYRRVMETLTVFQNNIDLRYIYCITEKENGEFVFSVDPTVVDPGEFGSPIVYTDALYSASQGRPAVDEVAYEDAWGRFYSAYSPVFNTAGNVAGIVAVDFDAEWYDAQIRLSVQMILAVGALSMVVGALIVTLFASKLRKRFRLMNVELSGLAREIDLLSAELSKTNDDPDPSKPSSEKSGGSDEHKHKDEILEIGRKIHNARHEMRRYANHMHTRANRMVTALASDYRSVYYIDLDSDKGVCYLSNIHTPDAPKEGDSFSYWQVFSYYGEHYVDARFREEFMRFIDPETIRSRLENESIIAHRYLAVHDGVERYEMLRMAGVRRPEDRDDPTVHAIGAGVSDVDVETREAMMRNRTLSDALDVAQASDKAKTAFLSSMSHEIRTPMNAIIGLDNIALNDPDISEKTRDYLEKIGVSAQHLLLIINDILDMSRIESGRMQLRQEEFSMTACIRQINVMIGDQCREKEIAYNCSACNSADTYFIGDSGKLRQILINILGNAVKFTPKGGEINFSVEQVAQYDGHTTLRFTIRDNGIGMAPSFLPHLFDAFSQEDMSATSRYGSTGLGMAITKNIVDLMNGDIEVQSEKGKGTTFFVTLTLPESEHKVCDAESETLRMQDMHVLVVDDDPISREHAKTVLSSVGVPCETVNSGPKAIELIRVRQARNEPFNLIMGDWQMPEMDGVETVRRIREIVGDDTAIIMLTAFKWDDVAQQAENIGVDSFIEKPLFPQRVPDQIRAAVQHRRLHREALQHKVNLEGRRILLAEDVPINDEIITMILQMRGIITEHAENGRIAVDMFNARPAGYYDAVLMDMRMPEMDGLTATAAIRASGRSDAQTIPIIALTANAFDEDVQRSLQAGLNAHLSKPVDPENLFAALESLIHD